MIAISTAASSPQQVPATDENVVVKYAHLVGGKLRVRVTLCLGLQQLSFSCVDANPNLTTAILQPSALLFS
jgi:hypothetical protein